MPSLPVAHVLPQLLAALDDAGTAVLVAPPGAGKTTLVPLALVESEWAKKGRILVLEPRRIAARAAARRMAALLGEKPGETVGYAMRMESRVSKETRIMIVTEGVLARMIVDDPELAGISAVLFDEFHERSLDGDFALALALDARLALRPDLRLLVMSATLDGARVAKLLGDAPIVESEGRSYPVDIRYRERSSSEPVEKSVVQAVRSALAEEEGSILAFLPGVREINRAEALLSADLPADTVVTPLHGALDGKAQDQAIRPAEKGWRKIVLSTAIAETSVTIDGVRVVIDCGLSRLPRYEPATGLTRLETVRVSRASADQRAGRAGRTAPGVAIRLWRAEQTAALPAFTPPEILEADLSGLLLDCAAFGVTDPANLSFLDPPPAPALAEARALLERLDALTPDGRLTKTGEAMRKLALPVRLAHMVSLCAKAGQGLAAAELAMLLSERGLGGNDIDLDERLARFRREGGARTAQARKLAARLARMAGDADPSDPSTKAGPLLVHAWPDRVAKARGAPGRFVLANGRGGVLEATERLAGAAYLVVANLQGRAENARIAAAAEIDATVLEEALANMIEERVSSTFDKEKGTFRVRKQRRLGAIVLSERTLPQPRGEEAKRALVEAIGEHGLSLLPWDKEATALRARLAFLFQREGAPWPDVSDVALLERMEDWLVPFLSGEASLTRISPGDLRNGLTSLLPYPLDRQLDARAPSHFNAPSGSRVPIRYEEQGPVLAIRVQELFGLTTHPALSAGVPLKLELLSPANRPIQTTLDLPGFWRGSWADVRAQMRGRYPKHPWPEDPANAVATHRAKPRGK